MRPQPIEAFRKQYREVQKLGEGSYGEVFKVKGLQQEKCYADKRIQLRKGEKLESFLSEIHTQRQLAHPLVVEVSLLVRQIFEFFVSPAQSLSSYPRLDIIMELGSRSLAQAIHRQQTYFALDSILKFAYDFVKLFATFQLCQFAHRDIKPENFILFDCGEGRDEKDCLNAKLTDFGVCTHVGPHNEWQFLSVAGSQYYMSPALKMRSRRKDMNTRSNPFKDDVYSLGLTLYELITRKTNLKVIQDVSDDVFRKSGCKQLATIVTLMLEANENKRPDFLELKKLFLAHFGDLEGGCERQQLEMSSSKHSKMSLDLSNSRRSLMSLDPECCSNARQELWQSPQKLELDRNEALENETELKGDSLGLHESRSFTIVPPPAQLRCENFSQNSKSEKGLKQSLRDEPRMQRTLKTKNLRQEAALRSSNKYQYQELKIGAKFEIRCVQVLEGFVWLGCSDGGVHVISFSQIGGRQDFELFEVFSISQNHRSSLMKNGHRDQYINCLRVDREGNLWIANGQGRIIVLESSQLMDTLRSKKAYETEVQYKPSLAGKKRVQTNKSLKINSRVTREIELPVSHKGGVSFLLCEDSQKFAVGFESGHVYTVWNGVTHHFMAHLSTVTQIQEVGGKLYSSSTDGSLKCYDLLRGGLEPRFVSVEESISSFFVSCQQPQPLYHLITTEGSMFQVSYESTQSKYSLSDFAEQSLKIQNYCSVIDAEGCVILGADGSLWRNGHMLSEQCDRSWSCIGFGSNGVLIVGSFQGALRILVPEA